MSGRKYKSGAEKQKIKLNREKERSKCAKISNFVVLENKNKNLNNVGAIISKREINLIEEIQKKQQNVCNNNKELLELESQPRTSKNNVDVDGHSVPDKNIQDLDDD